MREQAESAEITLKSLHAELAAKEGIVREVREEMQKQVTLVEQNAKSQIQYLQSRIKEIVEETQQDSPTHLRYT